MELDLTFVRALAELMEEKNLASLSIADRDQKISIDRTAAQGPVAACQTMAPVAPAPAVPAPDAIRADASAGKPLNAPMVGVVYASPEPGAEPFVQVGSWIKKGQTLCIIEAMKLMNEFTAPQDGEILEICFEDGQLVEFGQCLFRIG